MDGDSRFEALETPYGDGFFFGYAEEREARDEFETSFFSELMPGWAWVKPAMGWARVT